MDGWNGGLNRAGPQRGRRGERERGKEGRRGASGKCNFAMGGLRGSKVVDDGMHADVSMRVGGRVNS